MDATLDSAVPVPRGKGSPAGLERGAEIGFRDLFFQAVTHCQPSRASSAIDREDQIKIIFPGRFDRAEARPVREPKSVFTDCRASRQFGEKNRKAGLWKLGVKQMEKPAQLALAQFRERTGGIGQRSEMEGSDAELQIQLVQIKTATRAARDRLRHRLAAGGAFHLEFGRHETLYTRARIFSPSS